MVKGKPFMVSSKQEEQIYRIFSALGTPKGNTLTYYKQLPGWKTDMDSYKGQDVRKIFKILDDEGFDLLDVG